MKTDPMDMAEWGESAREQKSRRWQNHLSQSGKCCFLYPGAFMIPYLVMVVVCGIPLVFMEFTIGQYTRQGPVRAFSRICPLFKGERWSLSFQVFLNTCWGKPHVCRRWSGHGCHLLHFFHLPQCGPVLVPFLYVHLVWSDPPMDVLQQHLEFGFKLFQWIPQQQQLWAAVRQPAVLWVRNHCFISKDYLWNISWGRSFVPLQSQGSGKDQWHRRAWWPPLGTLWLPPSWLGHHIFMLG